MEKFVLQYSTGSYSDYYEHNYAIDAECDTDIKLLLLSAIESWKINYEKHQELYKKRPSSAGPEFMAWVKELAGLGIYHDLELGECGTICKPDFETMTDPDPLSHFRVLTLDEWLEENKPQKGIRK